MDLNEFLTKLAATGFVWHIDETINGRALIRTKDTRHCPISAVVGKNDVLMHPVSTAISHLHMPEHYAYEVYFAADDLKDHRYIIAEDRILVTRQKLLLACHLDSPVSS